MPFLIILISFFLSACSNDQEVRPLIIDKNTLTLSKEENTLEGTGRVVFNQPLFGLNSREFYFIKADFLHSNSSFILHSHFSDFFKQDSIKVFFIKEKKDLRIQVSTPGYKKQELRKVPDYFVKNQELSLYVSIQNGTDNFIDIQIWDSYLNPTGYLKTSSPFLLTENFLAQSQGLLFYSKGQGILWGMELNNVRLLKASRGAPQEL